MPYVTCVHKQCDYQFLFVSYARLLKIKVVPIMWLHYVSRNPPFIKTLITLSYKCFYKLHLS